jgi:hypothetical protein
VGDETHFCCLGVAAHIFEEEPWVPYGHGRSVYTVGGYHGTLPPDSRSKIGLSDDAQQELIYRNDLGQSFPGIADWIEENL